MPVVDFAQFVTIREPDPVSWVHSAQKDFGLRCSCWKEYDALVWVLLDSTAMSEHNFLCFFFKRGGCELVEWACWGGDVSEALFVHGSSLSLCRYVFYMV